jgi:hypothetical protein
MAITALDGGFRVPHMPPGDYYILVFAAGYLSPLDGVMVSNTKDSAQPGSVGAVLQEKAPKASIHGQETARVDGLSKLFEPTPSPSPSHSSPAASPYSSPP